MVGVGVQYCQGVGVKNSKGSTIIIGRGEGVVCGHGCGWEHGGEEWSWRRWREWRRAHNCQDRRPSKREAYTIIIGGGSGGGVMEEGVREGVADLLL